MIIAIIDIRSSEYMTLQMLKVAGLGVIKVTYMSEISFCVRPLIRPIAPNVLITRVAAKKIRFTQACFTLLIISSYLLPYCFYSFSPDLPLAFQ